MRQAAKRSWNHGFRLNKPVKETTTNLCRLNQRTVTVTASEGTQVFDRELKERQRLFSSSLPNSEEYDYVRREVANRLMHRLIDIERKCPDALELGCGSGEVYKELINESKALSQAMAGTTIAGIERLTAVDTCKDLMYRDPIPFDYSERIPIKRQRISIDQSEGMEKLPFEDNSFDIVLSSMYLHWINELPHILAEIMRVLKEDGAFAGSIVGGATLGELRSSLLLAEQERRGGVATHVSPLVIASDVGSLLQRSKFALVTVDSETLEIPYPSMFHLCEHLRGAGDTHCGLNRERMVSRDTALASAAIYDAMYALGSGTEMEDTPNQYEDETGLFVDGSNTVVSSAFQIIYFICWKPHESQAKPAERGSATHSFVDLEEMIKEAAEDVTVVTPDGEIINRPRPPSGTDPSSDPSSSK